jgi:hypothetical protein
VQLHEGKLQNSHVLRVAHSVLPALDSLNKLNEEVRSMSAEDGLYSKLLLKWTVGSEMSVSVGWNI